jgi:hypothetical protein
MKNKKEVKIFESYNIIHQAQINYYHLKKEMKAKKEKSF